MAVGWIIYIWLGPEGEDQVQRYSRLLMTIGLGMEWLMGSFSTFYDFDIPGVLFWLRTLGI